MVAVASDVNYNVCVFKRFGIDQVNPQGLRQTRASFLKNEKNYDLAIYKAWETAMSFKDQPFTRGSEILSALDQIHEDAISHLPMFRTFGCGQMQIHGKAGRKNTFGIGGECCSDRQGVGDLVDRIWKSPGTKLELVALDHEIKTPKAYILNSDSIVIQQIDKECAVVDTLKSYERPGKLSLKKTKDLFQKTYSKGFCNNMYRLLLNNTASVEERHGDALEFTKTYLEEIRKAKSDQDKIRAIAVLCRNFEQTHIYFDGNGRSVYLLANLLLLQNKLRPFYPKNMCLFDGKGLDALVKEIQTGQDAFEKEFGNAKHLTGKLRRYRDLVLFLEEQAKKFPETQKPLEQRNFAPILEKLDLDEYHETLMLDFPDEFPGKIDLSKYLP